MHLTVHTATSTPEFQYQIKGDGVMGRLLDEDDVLNAVDQRIQELQSHPEFRRKHADIDLYGIKEYIRQIPTAQQWIPCSDRLPEEGKDVLCCFYNGEHYRIIVSHRTDFNFWSGVGRTGDLIAWMPLPECYKGEQE